MLGKSLLEFFPISLGLVICAPPALTAMVIIEMLIPPPVWPEELFEDCLRGFEGHHCLPFTLWKFTAILTGMFWFLTFPLLVVFAFVGQVQAWRKGLKLAPDRDLQQLPTITYLVNCFRGFLLYLKGLALRLCRCHSSGRGQDLL